MRRIAPALGLAAVLVAVAGCASSSGTSTSASAPARTPLAAPTTARTTTRDPTPASAPRTVRAKPTSAPPRGIPPAHPVPAAFRVAAGAPSDAEVRRELAQMYAIQHQQQKLAAFSPVAGNYLQLLPWSLERKINQVSVASDFRDYGLGLACGGVLGRTQLGVAHKTAPCGTLVDFRYGGRELVLPVIDRGPYVAGREWDLTGAAADALRFPGLGEIQWSVVGG